MFFVPPFLICRVGHSVIGDRICVPLFVEGLCTCSAGGMDL